MSPSTLIFHPQLFAGVDHAFSVVITYGAYLVIAAVCTRIAWPHLMHRRAR